MSVPVGHRVNLTSSAAYPCANPVLKSSNPAREKSHFPAAGILQFRFGRLHPSSNSRGSVSIKVSSVRRPISSAVGATVLASILSVPPPQDPSSGDDALEATAELLRRAEKVVISTTKDGRTARAISNEPDYISDRYVKGSLKFQVELDQSFCLENTESETEVDHAQNHEELSPNYSSGRDRVLTSGDEEILWRSKSYLRQALKRRQRYKEVTLRFSTKNLPFDERSSKDKSLEDLDKNADKTELPSGTASNKLLSDEEELYLRRALNAKRQIATEIFEAALKDGQLGPIFTKELISFMPQFVDRIVTEAVALKKCQKTKELSFNSRARLYIRNSKVVQLVKWLKHQKLTAPRMGRLICVADESLGLIRSRIEWLRTIYVRGRDLGVIIERYPQILGLSVEDLNKTVDVLETAGVQRKWLGLVVSRQPRVLTLSSQELLEKISTITELGMSREKFGVMVYKFPALLGHFSVEEMESKVDYLKQIGIDDAVLVNILASTPQLLACNIEQSWTKLLRYFYFLRIELSGVRRIIGVNPSIFCLNLQENIAPKVKFLLAIGVHQEAIGQLIVEFPAVLTYSLEKKIRPLVRFLLEEAGVTEEKVGKVITLEPELIRCSLPNKLRVLVKYLLSKNISVHQLGRMIGDFPTLLMYSVPVLHPKFQYLIRVMKRPLDDVVAFPRYFSYSLKSRIIPRHELLEEKKLTFSLRSMLGCSDDIFNTKVIAVEQVNLKKRNMEEQHDAIDQEDHHQLCTTINKLNEDTLSSF